MDRYKVYILTDAEYDEYMTNDRYAGGSYVTVEANSEVEAMEKVGPNARSCFNASERDRRILKEQIAKQEAEQRKANREKEKAEALGLTLEEYAEYQKLMKNLRRHKTARNNAESEMYEAQRRMEREARIVEEYQEKIEKMLNKG